MLKSPEILINSAVDAYEVHDPQILSHAGAILKACATNRKRGDKILAAVAKNAQWRGKDCINLLAPEAPTSPTVRALLASEIGTRAAEGHIGPKNRWFTGTRYIDEVEALGVELLKELFRSNYAEHRLCASMIGNAVVYSALTQPGDTIMSIAQPFGGHSSNRSDGAAGMRGLKFFDIPMDPTELVVDLERFRILARGESLVWPHTKTSPDPIK